MIKSRGFILLCLLIIASFGFYKQGNAKTNVSYSVRGNTLTIRGKGTIPKKMKLHAPKNITKVVISKGITSIPNGFLSSCKSLKAIFTPGNVKISGDQTKMMCRNTVALTFTTPLKFRQDWFKNVRTRRLSVCKSDKKYASADGSIYTKNFFRLVMIPSRKKNLVLDNRCRILDTMAFTYNRASLSELTIPASITSVINQDKHKIFTYHVKCQITSMSENLLIDLFDSINYFGSDTNPWIEDLCRYYPNLVSLNKDCYVTAGGVLLTFKSGNNNSLTVPAQVKTIHKRALQQCRAKEIILPEGLKIVENEAFAFCSRLEHITIPSTVTSLGKEAFSFCSKLSNVTLPDGLTTLPDRLFQGCNLTSVTIPSTVRTLGKLTFFGCPLKTISLGSNILKIGSYCFSQSNPDIPAKVFIEGNLKSLPEGSFSENMTLYFRTNSSMHQTSFSYVFPESLETKKIKNVSLKWASVNKASGYQLEFSTKKNFKKCIKKVSLKKRTYSWKPIKNLKKLYIRIRPYSYTAGKRVYGRWNAIKILSKN